MANLTDEEYLRLENARPMSSEAWDRAVSSIKAARGGIYPADWYTRVSGSMKFKMNLTTGGPELLDQLVEFTNEELEPTIEFDYEGIKYCMSQSEFAEYVQVTLPPRSMIRIKNFPDYGTMKTACDDGTSYVTISHDKRDFNVPIGDVMLISVPLPEFSFTIDDEMLRRLKEESRGIER